MVGPGLTMGVGILAITALIVWLINRDKNQALAKRWPPTFLVTLLGCLFGAILVIYSVGLPTQVTATVGDAFVILWAFYMLAGLVACIVAWTHPGRIERKAFRNALAEGLPTPLPMITAQRMATRVGIVCFALIMVATLVAILTRDPNTRPESMPLELIMITGIYPSMAIVALAWWIQHRRVKRRDEDFHKAQERQLERLAQETSAAYRNGFDDGKTSDQ